MTANVSMKALLESGVHFGHRTHKWNPLMKPYIFTERNGIHIIDLQQTVKALNVAYNLVSDVVANGGVVLFVGTKRQAQETIQLEAERCEMPYVNARWLGGTLTNWRTIRDRINELERLERMRDGGDFERMSKKEALTHTRKIDKLEGRLSGIRKMVQVPDLLFAVDVRREETSIHEANLLGIPVVALVDTNCDPRNVDYIIPSNDDAIRAIKLLVGKVADAVLDGRALRKDDEELEAEDFAARDADLTVDEELSDEDLLGEATLAKLDAQAAAAAPVAADGEAAATEETAADEEEGATGEAAAIEETAAAIEETAAATEDTAADEETTDEEAAPEGETQEETPAEEEAPVEEAETETAPEEEAKSETEE